MAHNDNKKHVKQRNQKFDCNLFQVRTKPVMILAKLLELSNIHR